ncbi:MAG TPA: ribbon-helix-helix protein, CopG family [Candidatus Acidoferrales bacterium]|jgi:hypothetical protein|nr:ribbon-helix-helix protein, CopG family [Candidatus Acidoferrales bacterium]
MWYNGYTGLRFHFDPRKDRKLRKDSGRQATREGIIQYEENAQEKKTDQRRTDCSLGGSGERHDGFFTGGRMMNPIQRVNVDFTAEMLEELDKEAAGLNISRQAVIKTLVREGLDRRNLQRVSSRQGSVRIRASRRPRRIMSK